MEWDINQNQWSLQLVIELHIQPNTDNCQSLIIVGITDWNGLLLELHVTDVKYTKIQFNMKSD